MPTDWFLQGHSRLAVPLLINNDEVEQVLTMPDTLVVLDAQKTLFLNSIGVGAQFAAAAHHIYTVARARPRPQVADRLVRRERSPLENVML